MYRMPSSQHAQLFDISLPSYTLCSCHFIYNKSCDICIDFLVFSLISPPSSSTQLSSLRSWLSSVHSVSPEGVRFRSFSSSLVSVRGPQSWEIVPTQPRSSSRRVTQGWDATLKCPLHGGITPREVGVWGIVEASDFSMRHCDGNGGGDGRAKEDDGREGDWLHW